MKGAITPMALVCLKDQKDMHNVHFIPRHHTEDKLVITQHFSSFIYFTDTKIDMDNIYKQNYESWQFKFFFIKELKTSK
jgi:hypothetical protein